MVFDPNEPPARPSRLIIPGRENVGEEKPRIILPPGVSRETPEDLPEYPRLRRVMMFPYRDGEREVIVVQDPLGITPGQPVLGIESLAILQMLDGTVSLSDLTAAVMRESKDLRVGNMIREFVAQLDGMLLLESPRFERALSAARAAYHPLEIRPAALEGTSYPIDRVELDAMLDAHFAEADAARESAGEPRPALDAVPRALLAPHLDPRREGALMARAFAQLGVAPSEPLRVVILGTGHQLSGDYFALTRKHFDTPLGRATCDTAFVDHVAERLGEPAYHSELVHRDEHSIEFMVLYLQKRLGERPFTIVPILCGGFYTLLDEERTPREELALETLIDALREAEHTLGGRTVYVASADLSHVGPRFGDQRVTDEVSELVRSVDDAAIEAARTGDADAWFGVVGEKDDATRICGFAPTYIMLRAASPSAGRALGYVQSKEEDTSIVSVAALVWPEAKSTMA
ncbi:MAG: AmmeMemoRadiSam system protein B [Candidatus Eisenbacteria bacterium]